MVQNASIERERERERERKREREREKERERERERGRERESDIADSWLEPRREEFCGFLLPLNMVFGLFLRRLPSHSRFLA